MLTDAGCRDASSEVIKHLLQRYPTEAKYLAVNFNCLKCQQCTERVAFTVDVIIVNQLKHRSVWLHRFIYDRRVGHRGDQQNLSGLLVTVV